MRLDTQRTLAREELPGDTTDSVSIGATAPTTAFNLTLETCGDRSDGGLAELPTEFQGYGQLSLNAVITLQPPPPPPPLSGLPPHMDIRTAALLTDTEVRHALLNHASSSICFGKDCPKEMVVTGITSSDVLEYVLETFCESREIKMAEAPHMGGTVDGPSFGPPPPPWSIPCQPDSLFSDHEKTIKIPHTTSVDPCSKCAAKGYKQCGKCLGKGRMTCSRCNGSRRVEVTDADTGARMEQCLTCDGQGSNRCDDCNGDGRVACSSCNGFARVESYHILKVTYRNHQSKSTTEYSGGLPNEVVSKVSKTTIFEQTLPQVRPITDFVVPIINTESQRLVQQHRTAFPTELLLYQRQTLRTVPATEVCYSWKERKTRFWVYGMNRDVYAPDYPDLCCCTIL